MVSLTRASHSEAGYRTRICRVAFDLGYVLRAKHAENVPPCSRSCFLIIFPFALWKAWKNIQPAKASTGWPTVSGTVTASETVKVMFRKQPRVTYS